MPSVRPLLVAALSLLAIPLGHAGMYARFSGLYTQPGDISVKSASAFSASLKNNLGVSGAVGYKFSLLRLEGELLHVSNDTEPNESSGTLFGGIHRTVGSTKETAGFANGYVDLPSFFGLAPYLGAGLGYARISIDGLGGARNDVPFVQFSGTDSVFGYQGMLGVQFHLLGQATVHAGYRIMKREDLAVRDVVANARQTLSVGTSRMFELGFAVGF